MGEKDRRMEEPRLERVVAWFTNEDGAEAIREDINKLSHVLYFFNKDQLSSFYQKIKQLDRKEYAVVFKNLMQLYPLSSPVVMEILKDNTQAATEVLTLYDLGDELAMAWKRLLKVIKQQSVRVPAIVKSYEDKVKNYEMEKADCIRDIESLKKAGCLHKALFDEVERLKLEYEELNRSYTEEALSDLKTEMETKLFEKRKMQEQYNKDKQQIKEIENDLKIVGGENNSYKKSLKALSDVVKTLSDCEVD